MIFLVGDCDLCGQIFGLLRSPAVFSVIQHDMLEHASLNYVQQKVLRHLAEKVLQLCRCLSASRAVLRCVDQTVRLHTTPHPI